MIGKNFIEKEWLSSIASHNPLIRVNPISTASASREHLKGIAEISERIAGLPRTKEADIALANNIKLGEQAFLHIETLLETETEDQPVCDVAKLDEEKKRG